MKRENKQYRLKVLTKGLDVTIQGDPDCLISGISTIQDAASGNMTFLVNPLYRKYLLTTKATAVILSASDAPECPVTAIVCQDPHFVYTQMAAYFDMRPTMPQGIHPSAVIGQHCQLAPSVCIGANCVIQDGVKLAANVVIGAGSVIGNDCEIDEDSRLDANVTLYHRTHIGKRVIVASGTVIGSDGFGFAKHQGKWHKVPQLGNVIIEDDVEIGANCTIDRGAIDNTVIEQGARLDNLIQIGHNVRIGKNTAIAGCVGVAGSTTIGSNCLVGGQAGFAGHITVADHVVITGGTAVTKSIREPGVYSSGVGGMVTHQEWRRNSARIQRLEQLIQRVKLLEQSLEERNET